MPKRKSITLAGALVKYCGHEGYFIADIFEVGNTHVVRANGKVDPSTLIREKVDEAATHTLSDFKGPNFWRPDLGVFVVPKRQLKLTERGEAVLSNRDKFYSKTK